MNKIDDQHKKLTEAHDTLDLTKKEEVKEINVKPEVKFVQTADELGTHDKPVKKDDYPRPAM